jgi:DNA-binding NarL/FixJ family response regulator
MAAPKTVVFVEDDRRFTRMLALLLQGEELRVSFFERGREALAKLDELAPDACVVDLGLPDMDGTDLVREILRRRPGCPVLVLSIASSEAKVLGAIRAGAAGYIMKEDAGTLLVRAIDEAMQGGAPMSRSVAQLLLSEIRGGSRPAKKPEADDEIAGHLTPRETEVVELLARGLSYSEVGNVLRMSSNTVRTHVRSIYDKLLVCSKTEAVMTALRLGLIPSATQ